MSGYGSALPRTLVVSTPEMLKASDLDNLRSVSEVVHHQVSRISPEELAALTMGFDYLLINYDAVKVLPPSFYTNGNVKALRLISFDMTGMHWASPSAGVQSGVLIANVPHYSTESVAESILCEFLLHAREVHRAYVDEVLNRSVQARMGVNLRGRTAGVVGLGAIGTRVAELLNALGMRVICWNRREVPGYELVSLPVLFSQASLVCVALRTVKDGPGSNVGMIGDALLSGSRGAIIVNLANFLLVDVAAMVRALTDGRVAAYTVLRSEESINSPLVQFEQVHLSPANAWASPNSVEMLKRTWIENVVDAIDGHPKNLLT